MTPQSTLDRPLSEGESAQLGEWLADVSPLDLHGVNGLFHAVIAAPSRLSPSSWLAVVLPDPSAALDTERMEALILLLLRGSNAVAQALQAGQVTVPEPDALAECESFAAGYSAGAALDPAWMGDAARWSLVEPVAYLGGRLDLVSNETIEAIERDRATDPKRALCENLRALVHAASYTSSGESAAALSDTPPAMAPRAAPKVGRNERCPCGSGKKYKHCCLRAAPGSSTGS